MSDEHVKSILHSIHALARGNERRADGYGYILGRDTATMLVDYIATLTADLAAATARAEKAEAAVKAARGAYFKAHNSQTALERMLDILGEAELAAEPEPAAPRPDTVSADDAATAQALVDAGAVLVKTGGNLPEIRADKGNRSGYALYVNKSIDAYYTPFYAAFRQMNELFSDDDRPIGVVYPDAPEPAQPVAAPVGDAPPLSATAEGADMWVARAFALMNPATSEITASLVYAVDAIVQAMKAKEVRG